MTITFPGMFLIPLGLLFFVRGKNYLYYLTIFFIPFTATSLVNSATESPLVASNYFIILLTIKELFYIIKYGRIKFPSLKENRKPFKFISIFIFVVILSLLMPLFIDGSFSIFSGNIADINYEFPVKFSKSNINRVIPLLLGFILTYIVIVKSSSLFVICRSIQIYIVSVFTIALWGWLQFICNKFNIDYPFFLFNSMAESLQMSEGIMIETGVSSFTRINSVTQEPSHFTQIILTVLPIFLVSFAQNIIIFTKVKDRIMFAVMLLIILISTSSSGLLSIIIFLFVFTLIAYINSLYKVRFIIYSSFFITFISTILYFNVPVIQDFLNELIFTKRFSGSALERVYGISVAWSYFLEYPILGLGWGVVTSHDLIVLLLANSGIIGLLAFFTMVSSIFSDAMRNIKVINTISFEHIYIYLNGFIISIVTYLITCAFVEFTWYLSHFYFMIGIIVAINTYINNIIKTKLHEY